MKIRQSEWITELNQRTQGLFPTERIPELLKEFEIQKKLETQTFSRFSICAETLSICAPLMEKLFPEPDCGWLNAAHDYLAYRIYPAAEHPAESGNLAAALQFFVVTLSAVIRHEMEGRAFDPLFDIVLLLPAEYRYSRIAEEYADFVRAIEEAGYIPLLHIARECKGFNPLAHTAGVHHVAMHTARQMNRCGIPADIALVSAASLSHDIGKFGCRKDDAARIPYLHYFFTDQWLRREGLPSIAHIAANHSTWDLEYENLPAESLSLIYADFRVRGYRNGNIETTTIYSLRDAADIVFNKLANVDEVKRRRYRLVYQKLNDFEAYLANRGVNPDSASDELLPVTQTDPALLSRNEAADAIKYMAIGCNLQLMDSISSSASFEQLLERARSEKNLGSIRTYLNLFDEYFPYMTRAHKLHILSFLYELLMHHERDVRRQAGLLMGRILANSGLQYRKELPEHAPETAIAPTLSEMLAECTELWRSFLKLLIQPDAKIEQRHSLRIKNSLKIVTGSLLSNCHKSDIRLYLDPLLDWFRNPPADRFALCDSITHIPPEVFTAEELSLLTDFVTPMVGSSRTLEQICALRSLEYLTEARPDEMKPLLRQTLDDISCTEDSVAYLLRRLRQLMDGSEEIQPEVHVSDLFLDNFKTTVHWIVKTSNIDRLSAYAEANPSEAFHVATHFSNLLLISEHLPVREHAGQALAAMADKLSVDEINEIVIDLCRGIESGQAEFAHYVPPCLAVLILCLPAGQAEETIDMLDGFVRSESIIPSCTSLYVFGALLARLMKNLEKPEADPLYSRIISTLMAGLAHFEEEVYRAAFLVLSRDIFGNAGILLSLRQRLFIKISKKLLTIISEQKGSEITFFNTAAMLNHIYRMMIESVVDIGPFHYPEPGDVAFFPGTFDPFSDGHKRIVTEILQQGFEVYLAVDEFSWSKRTQPKLLRRKIALMSVADCPDVYLFPDNIPVNIANPSDLRRLKQAFPQREVYLVAGSDVIENASAYADPSLEGCVCSFNHILFKRSHEGDDPDKPSALERLSGKVIVLSLPTYYEDVSSTRIREYIDKNLEISMMVDPVVEAFIHQRGLYLRTPQYKRMLRPEEERYVVVPSLDEGKDHQLNQLPAKFTNKMRDTMRSGSGLSVLFFRQNDTFADGAIFAHTANVKDFLSAFGSIEQAEYLRQRASGKILMIDDAFTDEEGTTAELLNELLTASLSSDHTYAIYQRKAGDTALYSALKEKGFVRAGTDNVLMVDMRSPVVITCDAFIRLKEPFQSDPEVIACVHQTRKRLLAALCSTFPGELVLAFDTARINQALINKVEHYNGVPDYQEKPRKLGPCMCVPYGMILSDIVVPNTVTKTLHVEKVFNPDIRHFSIEEAQNYSSLENQLAAIHSFNRPVLLVDDLLHNGYRLEKLDPLFKQKNIPIEKILVGVLSGRGKDLMDTQGHAVDTVYWIPNLKYWFTESRMYPFIGGDRLRHKQSDGTTALPSINLILPYKSPEYLRGVSAEKKRALSITALSNAYKIMHTLEQRHKLLFRRSLTISRLGEALFSPCLPDRGRSIHYDESLTASAYLRDDIGWMQRLSEDTNK